MPLPGEATLKTLQYTRTFSIPATLTNLACFLGG